MNLLWFICRRTNNIWSGADGTSQNYIDESSLNGYEGKDLWLVWLYVLDIGRWSDGVVGSFSGCRASAIRLRVVKLYRLSISLSLCVDHCAMVRLRAAFVCIKNHAIELIWVNRVPDFSSLIPKLASERQANLVLFSFVFISLIYRNSLHIQTPMYIRFS